VADGRTLDTAAIQAAVDACAAAGGGSVVLRGGVFKSATIRLRSLVTLDIAKGATLLGSENADDYPAITPAVDYLYRDRFKKSLIFAERESDIALRGAGIVDGQGRMFPAKKGDDLGRPYIVRFSECRNVRVSGLTFRDSARWLSHYLVCTNVDIEGVTIHSRIRENRDGMDIDSCDGVRISKCNIFSGDDSIVLKSTAGIPCRNVTVTDCRLSSLASALKLGTESQGGFSDILFRDCTVYDTRDGIAIEEVDGGVCERVTVSNIVMRNVGIPIFVRLGNRATPIPGRPVPGVGRMRDVVIRDIEAAGAGVTGCSITGIPGHPVENVTVENIRIRFAGGGTAADAAREPPEKEASYPKGDMFGTLPAFGFYCRHVAGLTLRNLDISVAAPDARPAVAGFARTEDGRRKTEVGSRKTEVGSREKEGARRRTEGPAAAWTGTVPRAGSARVRDPMLQAFLADPAADFDEIVFAERISGRDHWYGNFGNYCDDDAIARRVGFKFEDGVWWAYGEGARLCRLNLHTGRVTVLLDDPRGGIRDPQVHYDGRKILFSYRRGGEHAHHLCEIGVDGKGFRQLTDGPDDDIEPTYLPDGGIMFCSGRCRRYVPCWRTRVAILYRCEGDGSGVRAIASNAEQENTPWVLPDGRVLYMRWEYVDRNQLSFHHLWTVNPDGTGVMAYYGNERPGGVFIDAKPIPGSQRVVASHSPGHGVIEHQGRIVTIDPVAGPDEPASVTPVSQGARLWRDPYAISTNWFLVADGEGIHLMDATGRTERVHALPPGAATQLHEPQPLRARPREPLIPSRVDLAQATGRLVLQDVHAGRNMEGVARGEIRKLLILEQLPKPVNFSGGQEPLSIGGTFTLERVLGTVPVEPDGSACFDLPALRSFFFVALDANERAVKRMQSFVTLQPGETAGCVGCHERRTQTPPAAANVMAMRRAPSRVEPVPGVPDVLDFPRDVQPILDRHCVECHRPGRRDGGVELTGDRLPLFSVSYWTIVRRGLISDGRNSNGNRAPRAIGSSASRLLDLMDGSHEGAKPTTRERDIVRLWIESGAVYPGTYAGLGCGMYPVQYPAEAIERRCGSCHVETVKPYPAMLKMPHFRFGPGPAQPLVADETEITFIRRLAYYQHGEAGPHQLLCNLDRPEMSLLVRAPLAKEAGGLGLCRGVVFRDASDPEYRAIVASIAAAGAELAKAKRFDMPGFRPHAAYVREMQRFGILPAAAASGPLDPYALDQAYWRSFWHKAATAGP
jgi:polygalacturonase